MKNLKNIILKTGMIVLGLCPFISNAQWSSSAPGGSSLQYLNSQATLSGAIDVGGSIYGRSNWGSLNKAGTSWVTWATRDVSGTETKIALNQISTMAASGDVTVGNIFNSNHFWMPNKAGTANLNWATRDISGSEATIILTRISSLDVVGDIYTRSNFQTLNKAANGWIQWATRDVSGSETKMALNNISYIKIGNQSPAGLTPGTNYGLSVDGKIYCQEVNVTPAGSPNWADFVFKSDYKLAPLTEVEKYIQKNGHLENVPSADEVTKDGYKVGEMDAKLLRKIEELTLYLLEQDKKYQAQQKEIEGLKAQIGNK